MRKLAIIGLGPRGLFALEELLKQLARTKSKIKIFGFESTDFPGAGPVWNPKQPNSNWINITERLLDQIKERPEINLFGTTVSAFPSYHDWCDFSLKAFQKDRFPPRNKLGEYLNQRFESLHSAIKDNQIFELIKAKVQTIDCADDGFELNYGGETLQCHDVLLTIGHQPTNISDQLKQWKQFAKNKTALKVYEDTYPVQQFKALKNKTDMSVGIRGFGLAMVDVMRYLTINNYGNFKIMDEGTLQTCYYKVKPQNLKLIPFSLDGLPLAPKPYNEITDNWYSPRNEEIESLKNAIITSAQSNPTASNINFLLQPFSKIATRVFFDLYDKSVTHQSTKKEVETLILHFLKNDDYQHPLIQDDSIDTYDLIKKYIHMALGKAPVTLDFCVWQVWRHCQPTFYRTLSHSNLDDELMEDIIALDEGSKRFTYGPPIESMQQILALVDADVLSLNFVNDPEIETIEDGWKLKNSNGQTISVSVMINSVLDSPKLVDVTSPLVVAMLKNKYIKPIHNDLGIATEGDGHVKSKIKDKTLTISVLGRLAKGSVLGVDAILECFGPRIKDWAAGYVKHL